jgi:hypothetical protein
MTNAGRHDPHQDIARRRIRSFKRLVDQPSPGRWQPDSPELRERHLIAHAAILAT